MIQRASCRFMVATPWPAADLWDEAEVINPRLRGGILARPCTAFSLAGGQLLALNVAARAEVLRCNGSPLLVWSRQLFLLLVVPVAGYWRSEKRLSWLISARAAKPKPRAKPQDLLAPLARVENVPEIAFASFAWPGNSHELERTMACARRSLRHQHATPGSIAHPGGGRSKGHGAGQIEGAPNPGFLG